MLCTDMPNMAVCAMRVLPANRAKRTKKPDGAGIVAAVKAVL